MNKQTKDLTDKKFGRLLIIRPTKKRTIDGCVIWNCECDCGIIREIPSKALLSGNSRSCGCYNKSLIQKDKGVAGFNKLLYSYKKNAKRRKRLWDISDEHFKELINERCYYCNTLPSSVSSHAKGYQMTDEGIQHATYLYNGLDRIDNDKGYTPNNVRTCCSSCNYAKEKKSQKEFYMYIERISNNLLRKGLINIKEDLNAKVA